MSGVFLGDWKSIYQVVKDLEEAALLNHNIIVAAYYQGCYEGHAYVLAEKDGILWETEGGHCSCNGIEGLWHYATQVNKEYLINRVLRGSFCEEEVRAAVCDYLKMPQPIKFEEQ